ncbi:DinB family protein [Lunatibacter salilacus]|uniref:DinB family protein n=1 Tax=Lunatibacter salilacus TaxID=2483804 RepID=UPI00131B0079|nr:DinB family protein [Lunatibacter salilacus]
MSNSSNTNFREVWQRGPVKNIPPLLQPVAHALVQTGEDAEKYTINLDDETLWERPAGVASVGFHLQHIVGVLDRLFTYAAGNTLNDTQLEFLKNEGNPENEHIGKKQLLHVLQSKIKEALQLLEHTEESSLTEIRYLGRAKIETTKMGLLFHAAEHAQRHIGQLLVTAKWVSQK